MGGEMAAGRICVALSGGVDSAVAALLLKQAGHEVIGVTMSLAGFGIETERRAASVAAARAVAEYLEIPFVVADVDEAARTQVIGNFIEEYTSGRTPNPCVRCNTWVKFDALFRQAEALGADGLATGHYARILGDPSSGWGLYKAKDAQKDQSYFLYGIARERLGRIRFPLGDLTKAEVRAIAAEAGLPSADRAESQDICFVRDGGYQDFLRRHAGEGAFRPGPFLDHKGQRVGDHKGIGQYTIGQREGLGLALGYPTYVYAIDVEQNTVYVGPRERLVTRGLVASGCRLLYGELAEQGLDVEACIRYNARAVPARVRPVSEGEVEVVFSEPQYAVTPGQSVVFYQGDRLLGGAVIEAALGNSET